MNDELDPRADDLERLITAHQTSLPGRETTAPSVLHSDVALATALLDLAPTISPDPTWSDDLERRLLVRGTDATATREAGPGGVRWAPRPLRPPHVNGETSRRAYRRWRVLGGVAAALLLSLLVLTPQVRAGVNALLQLGAVHIAAVTPTALPNTGPTATPLPSVLDLAGETTLAQARQQAGIPILLPTYPPDLGPPDHVFLQDFGGPMVVLVWTVPGHPDQARMSLHELSSNIWLQKFPPHVVQQTTVNGQPALWTDGPYQVEIIQDGQVVQGSVRLVTGHVLIWASGSVTYRLETSLSLPEAVRVAESLR